ncbi:MBL fold metallo-hydrolase [Pedobacter sp. MC2016-15]|uniref:MBL fold metallo-hydrolase n=1 Tax=Pedobacter sp. MC2016-15 TaxID=2994473 RepID=UPI0022459866|nr:MBL fold metallo-hydrolase [Pedobacter sp. MC2016-15]MCX2479836.1 MBL fold metallo-hydrolase [Pedobacter sp. MC2016-15]
MKRRTFVETLTAAGLLSIVSPFKVMSGIIASDQTYHIEQFKDKGLAHFSYAISVNDQIILIDPERDPQKYYDFAKARKGKITAVIETHPHADFVSSHREIQQKLKVKVYASSLTKTGYKSSPLKNGETIRLSEQFSLRALETPGHAPDHIAIVLSKGPKDIAVFSGDALLIGDVGRPDLRESAGSNEAQRKTLAGQMYHTIHDQFAKLADDVVVYPAHGAGSLCGKAIRDAASSTIGEEKTGNYAFRIKDKNEFVAVLLGDLPFVPKYFPYDVKLNIKGAPDLQPSLAAVKILAKNYAPPQNALIIDGRPAAAFKKSYLKGALNVQDGGKFESWLGSVVSPDDAFYLLAQNEESLQGLIAKTGKIGYEANIAGAFVYDAADGKQFAAFNDENFKPEEGKYTIIDVRTEAEVKSEAIFKGAINIPLQDLSGRISEIPTDKPILINCASGYRSATGSSILKKYLPEAEVLDLGAAVTKYGKTKH